MPRFHVRLSVAFTGVATTMIDAIETRCIDVAAKLFGQTIVGEPSARRRS